MQCGYVYVNGACCIEQADHVSPHRPIDPGKEVYLAGGWHLDGRSRHGRALAGARRAAPVEAQTMVTGGTCSRVAFLLNDLAGILRTACADDPLMVERAEECEALVKLFTNAARYRTVISQ